MVKRKSSWPVLVALFLILTGCSNPCPPGKYPDTHATHHIPDTIKALVPYAEGGSAVFNTIAGDTITFEVARTSYFYEDNWYDECNTDYHNSERDLTRMLSLESDADIRFELYADYNSSHIPIMIEISRNYFDVCTDSSEYSCPPVIDSMLINDFLFHDVFILTPYRISEDSEHYIPVDTVLYNFAYGILEIARTGRASISRGISKERVKTNV